jgi:hypothetical protein
MVVSDDRTVCTRDGLRCVVPNGPTRVGASNVEELPRSDANRSSCVKMDVPCQWNSIVAGVPRGKLNSRKEKC